MINLIWTKGNQFSAAGTQCTQYFPSKGPGEGWGCQSWVIKTFPQEEHEPNCQISSNISNISSISVVPPQEPRRWGLWRRFSGQGRGPLRRLMQPPPPCAGRCSEPLGSVDPSRCHKSPLCGCVSACS